MAGKSARKSAHTPTEKAARTFENKKRRAQRSANNTGKPVKIKNGTTWVTIEPTKIRTRKTKTRRELRVGKEQAPVKEPK